MGVGCVHGRGGMHGRWGCTWQGACIAGGGMHGRGACMAGGMCGRGHAWQGCVRGMPHWQILRDMVNERAVHILLECILVCNCYQFNIIYYVLCRRQF